MKRILIGLLMASLLLPTADAQGEQQPLVKPGGLTVRTDMQEILDILQPINMQQADRLSKKLFEDFFNQKNMIYGPMGSPTKQPALDRLAPPTRQKRQAY